MPEEINVQFKLETFKSDSNKMQRILKDMESYQTSTSDKEEAVRQWREEFQRRLKEASLTVS